MDNNSGFKNSVGQFAELTKPFRPGYRPTNSSGKQFKKFKLFIIILSALLSGNLLSQCLIPPSPVSCNPSGAITLINNDVVSAGQVKLVNSPTGLNSATVSGGSLIVCSSLTLNTISFTSGTIIINPGASILINTGSAIVFGNNCCIINYGNFKITGSIVTGQNNLIFNASPSSIFNVAFNQLVVQGPNTYVVNNGFLTASYIILQSTNSPGPICSNPGSYIVCNIMINQFANAFSSPGGQTCLNITQTIINSQPMTSTPNVNICYQSSNVSVIGSPNFGAATVNSNCPSCGVLLPINLNTFTGKCLSNEITLNWTSENEHDLEKYVIEKSQDGSNFLESGFVLPGLNKNGTQHYSYRFAGEANEFNYFRIKERKNNGDQSYSKTLFISCKINETYVYPSDNGDQYFVKSGIPVNGFKLVDHLGRLIAEEKNTNRENFTIDMSSLCSGAYILVLQIDGQFPVIKKIIHY